LIPDLKWEIKEVIEAGDRIIVRSQVRLIPASFSTSAPEIMSNFIPFQASGTPAGDFFGVPHTGKSFNIVRPLEPPGKYSTR
jgi:predicted ester cyclase